MLNNFRQSLLVTIASVFMSAIFLGAATLPGLDGGMFIAA